MYANLIEEITNLEILTNSLKDMYENFSMNSVIMIIMMIFVSLVESIKFEEISMAMVKNSKKPLPP